jgi:hypothetical protein
MIGSTQELASETVMFNGTFSSTSDGGAEILIHDRSAPVHSDPIIPMIFLAKFYSNRTAETLRAY